VPVPEGDGRAFPFRGTLLPFLALGTLVDGHRLFSRDIRGRLWFTLIRLPGNVSSFKRRHFYKAIDNCDEIK
jgi:hypothetical protein